MKIIIETIKYGRIDVIDMQDIESIFLNKNAIEIIRKGYKDNFIIDENFHKIPELVDMDSLFYKLKEIMDAQHIDAVLYLTRCCNWFHEVKILEQRSKNGSKTN